MAPIEKFEDDSEYGVEEEKSSGKKPRKSAAGRKLMRWNPDVDQLLLLTADAVCIKNGTPIPWDKVGPEIEPFLTGEAIKQHLTKLTKYREENERRVPEKLDKNARRKSAKGTLYQTTPAKNTDGEGGTPSKGQGLLWYGSSTQPKKNKPTPMKGNNTNPSTPQPMSGSGRKVSNSKSGGTSGSASTSSLTVKRTHPSTRVVADEDGIADGSPAKKRKGVGRGKARVNYDEHLSDADILDAVQEDEHDDGYENTPGSGGTPLKREGAVSQGSDAIYNASMPPPPKYNLLGRGGVNGLNPSHIESVRAMTAGNQAFLDPVRNNGTSNIGGWRNSNGVQEQTTSGVYDLESFTNLPTYMQRSLLGLGPATETNTSNFNEADMETPTQANFNLSRVDTPQNNASMMIGGLPMMSSFGNGNIHQGNQFNNNAFSNFDFGFNNTITNTNNMNTAFDATSNYNINMTTSPQMLMNANANTNFSNNFNANFNNPGISPFASDTGNMSPRLAQALASTTTNMRNIVYNRPAPAASTMHSQNSSFSSASVRGSHTEENAFASQQSSDNEGSGGDGTVNPDALMLPTMTDDLMAEWDGKDGFDLGNDNGPY